jgi:hypothetical protein
VSVPYRGDASLPAPSAIEVTSPFDDARRVRVEARETSEVLISVLSQAEPYRVPYDERCKASR